MVRTIIAQKCSKSAISGLLVFCIYPDFQTSSLRVFQTIQTSSIFLLDCLGIAEAYQTQEECGGADDLCKELVGEFGAHFIEELRLSPAFSLWSTLDKPEITKEIGYPSGKYALLLFLNSSNAFFRIFWSLSTLSMLIHYNVQFHYVLYVFV